jgi:hypothetical protein
MTKINSFKYFKLICGECNISSFLVPPVASSCFIIFLHYNPIIALTIILLLEKLWGIDMREARCLLNPGTRLTQQGITDTYHLELSWIRALPFLFVCLFCRLSMPKATLEWAKWFRQRRDHSCLLCCLLKLWAFCRRGNHSVRGIYGDEDRQWGTLRYGT